MDNKKFLIVLAGSVVAVFLGAFLAFWILFGNVHKHYQTSFIDNGIFPRAIAMDNPDDYFPRIDKMIENQQKLFNKINKDFEELMNVNPAPSGFMFLGSNKINNQNSASIKTEESKDSYKITVDLKPFNNDEKNVDLKVKDNIISISANYQSKDKNEFSSSHFYQSLTLPAKLNVKDIKQEKQGASLVITIPKELDNKDKTKS